MNEQNNVQDRGKKECAKQRVRETLISKPEEITIITIGEQIFEVTAKGKTH